MIISIHISSRVVYLQTFRTIMLIAMMHMMFSTVRMRLMIPKMRTSVGIEQLYTNSYALSTSSGQCGGERSTEVTTGSLD